MRRVVDGAVCLTHQPSPRPFCLHAVLVPDYSEHLRRLGRVARAGVGAERCFPPSRRRGRERTPTLLVVHSLLGLSLVFRQDIMYIVSSRSKREHGDTGRCAFLWPRSVPGASKPTEREGGCILRSTSGDQPTIGTLSGLGQVLTCCAWLLHTSPCSWSSDSLRHDKLHAPRLPGGGLDLQLCSCSRFWRS